MNEPGWVGGKLGLAFSQKNYCKQGQATALFVGSHSGLKWRQEGVEEEIETSFFENWFSHRRSGHFQEKCSISAF